MLECRGMRCTSRNGQRCQNQTLCQGLAIPAGRGAGPAAHPPLVPCPGCAMWGLAPRMRFLPLLHRDELFAMQGLLSRSAGRGGNGKSRVRSRALLLPGCFSLPTVWIYPDQTCQGKSWLYLKSHYGPSAFHHPADALCCSITPCGSRNCRGSLRAWWEGKNAAGLPPTSPHLHPRGAEPAGMTLQPFSGLNHQTWHQQWGVLASWGVLCRCWENGGAREHFLLLGGHQSSTSEPPQGECPEECEALLI